MLDEVLPQVVRDELLHLTLCVEVNGAASGQVTADFASKLLKFIGTVL